MGRKKIVETPVAMSKSILRFLVSSAPLESSPDGPNNNEKEAILRDNLSLNAESVIELDDVITQLGDVTSPQASIALQESFSDDSASISDQLSKRS